MKSIFTRNRNGLPRKGQAGGGGREYDENGYPIDRLPSGERPTYTNDAPGFSLRGNNGGRGRSIGEITGSEDLFPAFSEGESGPAYGGETGDKPSDSYDRPRSAPAPKAEETPADTQEEPAESDYSTYDFDAGLTDYYNRLYNKLRAYGVTSIPTLEALYGLFESFLRPSIDEAIRARNRQGAYNMAELDADAYSRGMGGSSYLSSMKSREQHEIADDVAALEGKYSASLAEYLYKALSTMQELEASLQKTAMQIAASNAAAASHSSSSSHSSGSHSSGSHSSSSSSSSSSEPQTGYGHNKNGAYFDGVWYEGDFSHLANPAGYYDYASYIEGLSAYERYLLFTSDQRLWRMRRWQMQYNLPQVDYEELYSTYFTMPTGGGGGGGTWHQMTR